MPWHCHYCELSRHLVSGYAYINVALPIYSDFATSVVRIKHGWKIVVRHAADEPDRRQGYAWAGSMGEALEMADDPNAVAIPQTHKMWPVSPGETFFWNSVAN